MARSASSRISLTLRTIHRRSNWLNATMARQWVGIVLATIPRTLDLSEQGGLRGRYDANMTAANPRIKPFAGTYEISTKKYYANGSRHMAYDYKCPLGTPVRAVRNGFIIDCQDGESDKPDSNYAGEPSNWILLGYKNSRGEKRTVYYQHLMQNSIKVKKGQVVKCGQWIAKSGNSGNTTGPHLHISANEGYSTRRTRYDYMYHTNILIYPPSLVWAASSL